MTGFSQRQHETGSQRTTTALRLFISFLCCLAAIGVTAHAQIVLPSSGDIGTVVGDGNAGYYGDGGQATSAYLYYPHGVAVDASGNIYIADTSNSVIRKVTASTGDISTVAGNGTSGYSGDGAAATSAEMGSPRGLALDSSGNIYIGDVFYNVVRKVTISTGYISTVAGDGSSGYTGDGGLATSATLDNPSYLAVDASGNLFISDVYNYVIREVSGGYISTVAGGGTPCMGKSDYLGDGCAATNAVLAEPEGIGIDSYGNLYIADCGAQAIREVLASTGVISVVAGTFNSYGFSGDSGAAGSAQLNSPFDVKVDGSNNLYIADTGNQRIRKVLASTGDISTVGGNGNDGYTGDGGAATSADLNNPEFIAADSNQNVYIADTYNFVVRAISH
jgi:hypothetical protein